MAGNIQKGFEGENALKVDNVPSNCLIPQKGGMISIDKVVNRVANINIFLHEKKWYLKGHKLFADQRTVKEREKIAINAKEISIGSEKIWVWAAVDLEDEMVIAVYASYVKSGAVTYRFLKNIAKLCDGKLPRVFVNGENWSQWAFGKLGFRYVPVDFGQDCMAEKYLSMVDSRILRYLEKFNNKNTPSSMLWWIESFAGFTNYWAAK